MDTGQARKFFDYLLGSLYWRESAARCTPVGKEAGTLTKYGYKVVMLKGKTWRVHQIVWLWHGRQLPGRRMTLDHINGNRSDNRIENLRIATLGQNATNKKLYACSTTGRKGVTRYKGLYRVRVQSNGVSHYLGDFEDLEFADLVATMAREKYHGMFARHA